MSLGPGRGVVESFDPEAGLGVIVDGDGRPWPFHCTVIVDGSRHIEPGTEVHFERSWGGPGHWEARSVSP